MSKSMKHFMAFIAIILSLALASGVVPAMLNASANPNENTIWFVPDEHHQVIHNADASAWWGEAWGYKASYSENGLHFETKYPGTAVRTGYTQTFNLDGLILAFNNLINEQSKAIITVMISATTFYTFDPAIPNNNTLDITLDTINGKIVFEDGTVLLENDNLKYANITEKAFELSFHKDNEGYKVTANIDGNIISGTTAFTSSMIIEHSDVDDEGHIVVGIAGGAGSEGLTSFDLNKIGGARASTITGQEALNASNFAIPVTNNFWPDRLDLRDAPTGGARMIFFSNGITNVRNGPWGAVNFDGMYLKVNNISVIGASDPKNLPEIAFVFTDRNAYEGGWEAAANMLAIVLDTRNGKLRFSNDTKFLDETYTIISNELLKYENISQREVVLRTFRNDDGSYKVQLEIEGKEPLFGTLPASCIQGATLFPDPQNAKMVVTPAIPEGEGMPGKAEFMIDLVEYYSTPEGELEGSESTDDPDITKVPGVTYLDTTQLKIYGSSDPEVIATKDSWAQSGGLVVTNLKVGVRMIFNNAVAIGHREGYNKKLNLDGTELTFRRLTGGDFALVFGNQDTIYPVAFGENTLLLGYSATEQKIFGKINNGTTFDIITGIAPNVLEENLFTYYFEQAENGGYILKVTAGDDEFSGTISSDFLTASGIADFSTLEMSVNPLTTGDSFSIDFIGVRRLETNDPDIDEIEGVIYLSKQLLKISSSTNPHEQNTMKSWTDSGLISITDLKKGVRFKFNTTEPNVRESYKEALNLKGLQLHFRGFQGSGFGITIADAGSGYPPEFSATACGLAIRYDYARQLIYTANIDHMGKVTESNIIENILISNNSYFTYTFSIDNDGNYTLTVDVDGVQYQGTITKSVIDQAETITNTTKVEISMNSGGFDSTLIDYIGVRQLILVDNTAVADTIAAIESIDEISLENGTPIRTARKLYDLLNSEEKELITNYSVLLKAEEEYNKLAAEADRALTYLNISNSRHAGNSSEIIQQTIKDWAASFQITNVPTGGLHLNYINAISGHREGYNKKVDMSDLFLQFDNLDASYPESCKFAVLFGKDSGSYYGIEYNPDNPPLALVLDTVSGTITAYPRNHIIIQSDYLKLDNICGKRFSYQLSSRGEDEGYDLTVCVAGQELEGTITYEDVVAATLLTSQSACNIMICPWNEENSTCTFSLDFIGICQTSLFEKVNHVISLIAALPDSISDSDIDTVKNVLAEYQSLSRTLRALVDNYGRLESAVAQVYELEKDDISWSNDTNTNEGYGQQNSANTETGVTFYFILILSGICSLIIIIGLVLLNKKQYCLSKGGRK